ncbi:hypothetical protein BKA57DRAFT_472265 [Linnemannia elongata]|nr:hypothetical protein BKA57DRAFT_472265 [Linnemannia elongata]
MEGYELRMVALLLFSLLFVVAKKRGVHTNPSRLAVFVVLLRLCFVFCCLLFLAWFIFGLW